MYSRQSLLIALLLRNKFTFYAKDLHKKKRSVKSDLSTVLLVEQQREPLVQLEAGLVVARLERPVVAQDLVDDRQHVVGARAVVRRRVAAAAARRA